MANYYATARSNYFGVKDVQAFKEWCNKRSLEFWEKSELGDENEDSLFAITPLSYDSGAWPIYHYNEETGKDKDFEIAEEICEHLKDGHVAILIEVGNEKLRYLNGYAIAVNNHGESKSINLNDITDMARELGQHVTEPEF